MKYQLTLWTKFIFILFAMALSKCSKNEAIRITVESEHFIIQTNSVFSSPEEVSDMLLHAEAIYDLMIEIVGNRHAPSKKIIINLKGDFKDQGPYFDPEGIHLFRYSAAENGYKALFTHELGHAIREDYYIQNKVWEWPAYDYYDEGFAEYIAQEVEPDKRGFPFYGYPENVVVGDMVISGNAIDQDYLRTHHDIINEPCKLQAYPLRASWCRYIEETYGLDKLLSIVYTTIEPSSKYVDDLLGQNLNIIDTDWEKWIEDLYTQIDEAEDIAERFKRQTTWYEYCNL